MIMPKKRNVISLQDMKRCRMTPIFFDTFFNLEKYLDHEQRDPFASNRDVDEDGNEVKKSQEHLLYVISFGCTIVQSYLQQKFVYVFDSWIILFYWYKWYYVFHFLQCTDWDRFAAEEYELLVAEEGNTEGMDEM